MDTTPAVDADNQSESVLSSNILKFYNVPRAEKHDRLGGAKNYRFISNDGILDWDSINEALKFKDIEVEIDEILSSYDQCAARIPEFHNLLLETKNFFRYSIPSSNLSSWFELDTNKVKCNLEWTNRYEDIKQLFVVELPNKSANHLQGLLLSALLEYSLGNVFHTMSGRNPPHLLKQLLQSHELLTLFPEALFLVRYLLGSPVSVNLRNVLWHGFPSTDEVDDSLAYLLLLITISLGSKMRHAKFHPKFDRLLSTKTFIKMEQINQRLWQTFKIPLKFEDLVESSTVILPKHKPIWLDAISLASHQHALALVLLLPQIEMMLRTIYGQYNDWDVTAKHDEYYIIMDHIVEDCIVGRPSQANLLKKAALDDTALNLFYDLFISLNGPRIRDRISHGEVALSDIDSNSFKTVLLFGTYVSLTFSKNDEEIELNYLSCFHPSAELKEYLNKFKQKLLELSEISFPEELKHFCGSRPVDNLQNLVEFKNPAHFIRHGYDSEATQIMHQIIENATKAAKNFKHSLKDRSQEFIDKKLSSARRHTFEKTVEHYGGICEGLQLIYNLMVKIIQISWLELNDDHMLRTRKLRKILQLAENLQKCLHLQNNDWANASRIKHALEEISKTFT